MCVRVRACVCVCVCVCVYTDAVKGMVDQILRVGRIVRPALGITIAVLPSQMMQQVRAHTHTASSAL